MAGLDPAIHANTGERRVRVDGRDEPGHDD